MIWQNPWALLGILALGVPILIHLLGRSSARITRFPTLRFVQASRLMATRRTRLSDLGLLAVRMGIIAAAVAALAMPLLLTAERQREGGRSVARVIIVDTSESMRRPAPDGTARAPALEIARLTAQRLASEAATSAIIETAAPADALEGALAWLATRNVRAELVIVSDFQVGAVDSVDLAAVPGDVGVGLARIDVEANRDTVEVTMRQGNAAIVARGSVDSTRSAVEWSLGNALAPAGRDSLVIIAHERDRAEAIAVHAAARSITTATPATGRPIAIVFGGPALFPELLDAAKPPNLPWQGDILVRLRSDPQLIAAASNAYVQDDVTSEPGPGATPYVSVARTDDGFTVVLATTGTVDGAERLILIPVAPAGSLLSAAVISAALRASSDVRAIGEIEPATLAEATLARWRREPAADAAADARGGGSDGRWLWGLALVLLAVETWMRRARRTSAAQEMVRERAA